MTESPADPDESGTEGEPAGTEPGEDQATGLPAKLTFRITPVSLLGVLTVAICVTPVAWTMPWMPTLYALPVLLLLWVLRVRTTVHGDGITTRTMFGGSRIDWESLRSLRLDERRWVRAVLTSGREVRLPAVRIRDLPRLAAMSGGRLSDPSADTAEE